MEEEGKGSRHLCTCMGLGRRGRTRRRICYKIFSGQSSDPLLHARHGSDGTHRLRRTREAVLEAGAALGRLVGVALDEVRHAVLWASAVHHLLRRVVRVRDVGPRDVAEVLAALQLPYRFARLKLKIDFERTGQTTDGTRQGEGPGEGDLPCTVSCGRPLCGRPLGAGTWSTAARRRRRRRRGTCTASRPRACRKCRSCCTHC